jgi:hypothetical protein
MSEFSKLLKAIREIHPPRGNLKIVEFRYNSLQFPKSDFDFFGERQFRIRVAAKKDRTDIYNVLAYIACSDPTIRRGLKYSALCSIGRPSILRQVEIVISLQGDIIFTTTMLVGLTSLLGSGLANLDVCDDFFVARIGRGAKEEFGKYMLQHPDVIRNPYEKLAEKYKNQLLARLLTYFGMRATGERTLGTFDEMHIIHSGSMTDAVYFLMDRIEKEPKNLQLLKEFMSYLELYLRNENWSDDYGFFFGALEKHGLTEIAKQIPKPWWLIIREIPQEFFPSNVRELIERNLD